MASNFTALDTFYEDSDANKYFFYNGKTSVIGISYPDNVILNDKNYKYMKLGFFQYTPAIVSEYFSIYENFTVAALNKYSGEYDIANVIITGKVKGKAVDSTLTVSATPLKADLSTPLFYITKESRTIDETTEYVHGVWISSENYTKIYITKSATISENHLSLTSYTVESNYQTWFLSTPDIAVDTDTTNINSVMNAMKIATSVNIMQDLMTRLEQVEAVARPDIQTCSIDYSASLITTGAAATEYQDMIPTSMSASDSFITLKIANGGFSVNVEGDYLIQLGSLITGTNSEKHEQVVSINDSLIPDLKRVSTPSEEKIYSGVYMAHLEPSDLIRTRFKFLGTADSGISVDGTSVRVIKLTAYKAY